MLIHREESKINWRWIEDMYSDIGCSNSYFKVADPNVERMRRISTPRRWRWRSNETAKGAPVATVTAITIRFR